jgi:hypothetical protein
MRLKEILDSKEINLVLVDTSIRKGNDFSWKIYDRRNYSSLNKTQLKEEIEAVRQLKEILEDPKTRTIRATTQEIRYFENNINSKIKYFSKIPLPRKRKIRVKIKEVNIRLQGQLLVLQEEVYQTRRLSYSKELRIEDNNYGALLDIVKLIDSEIKTEKDAGFILGFNDKNRPRNSDKDERLATGLYWLSLFSDKSSCLITKDEYFQKLTWIVTQLIGSESFLPHNEFFRRRIIENPFKINRLYKEKSQWHIDNSFTSYDRDSLIKKSCAQINETIKGDIQQMWMKFNPSGEQKHQRTLSYMYS